MEYDMITNNFSDLSGDKKNELDGLIDGYNTYLQLIDSFIEANNLDGEEIWDLVANTYDEDLTYAHFESEEE